MTTFDFLYFETFHLSVSCKEYKKIIRITLKSLNKIIQTLSRWDTLLLQ